jgi:aminoglycoside phosphotransferase (APT) family kinase protein
MSAVADRPLAPPPPPPRDPGLPALNDALRGDAVAAAMVAPGTDVVDCRARYLRYKPGQSCVVLYSLTARERGLEVERLVHGRFYAGGRGARIWARGTIQALAARVVDEGPFVAAAYVAELRGVVQAWPVDIELPALVRLGPGELVRYKPARKALVWRPGLYVKVHADARGARAFAAGRELHARGVPVVEPLRYSPRLRVLVQPEVDGRPATSGDATAIGEALARLHGARVDGLPRHSWSDDLARAAWAVGVARPDLGPLAERLARELADRLQARAAPPVVAHGDFYDDQVLVTPDGVLLLDLDRVTRADPLLDVGTFLAHLALAGRDAECDAFLAGYGRADERSAVLAEGAALLKLAIAPFRSLEENWPEEVERRLTLVEARLADAARRNIVEGARDRTLPQLEVLTDLQAMSGVLGGLWGKPVRAEDVVVLRHRPGRRCTLRYRLAGGDRIYAKTYASDRAPRVYRTLLALANVPGVAVPRPLGCVPELHLVVQRELQGARLTPELVAGNLRLAERLAEALHALHASGAVLERAHTLADELEIVQERIRELPETLREPAQSCLWDAASDARSAAWRLRPVHRDLYHEQVLIDGDRVALLDVDDAAMSEPAVDVANVAAHLRLLAREQPHAAEQVARWARAFLACYARLDPELDEPLAHALEAATLIRLACIHHRRGGDALAEALIGSSREVLRGGDPAWP